MTDLEIANMLAAYHKECNATDEIAEKGMVQLKHARLIREAIVKNCSIPNVVGRCFSAGEVIGLFKKLENERANYYAEDAADILPLDDFLRGEGLKK